MWLDEFVWKFEFEWIHHLDYSNCHLQNYVHQSTKLDQIQVGRKKTFFSFFVHRTMSSVMPFNSLLLLWWCKHVVETVQPSFTGRHWNFAVIQGKLKFYSVSPQGVQIIFMVPLYISNWISSRKSANIYGSVI